MAWYVQAISHMLAEHNDWCQFSFTRVVWQPLVGVHEWHCYAAMQMAIHAPCPSLASWRGFWRAGLWLCPEGGMAPRARRAGFPDAGAVRRVCARA